MALVDLFVNKTASPNPVIVGQPVTFDVAVGNNGPDFAINAVLTDILPTGICLSDITVSQGNYCYENGTITWTIPIVNTSNPAIMTITVIPQQANIPLVNSAHVEPNPEDTDEDPNNNDASVTVEVTPSADLLIIKESCPVDTIRGSIVNYTFTVINNGPSTANNVIVTDTLPTGVTPVLPLPSGWTQSGNILTYTLSTLDANQSVKLSLPVNMSNVEGPLINSVEVTSDTPDPNLDNNEDEVTTNVSPAADISIVKTVSADVVEPFQLFTYTLTVTNNGPSTATNVIVTDTLPLTVQFVNAVLPPGAIIVGVSFPDITFSLPNLAPGAITIIEINVRATAEGMVCNSAVVSALEADPNPCNNNSSVCAFVTRTASTDVSVTKTHSPEPAGICSPVLYTITVTNNGLISATGIMLVDQIPSSLEIISINTSQGRCCICDDKGCDRQCSCNHNDRHKEDCHKDECSDRARPCSSAYYPEDPCHKQDCQGGYGYLDNCPGHPHYEPPCKEDPCHEDNHEAICSRINEIVCQLGALAPGASAIVQILARPKMIGTITNTAIVTANEADSNQTNNQVTDTLTVIPLCDQLEQLINMVNEMITNGDIEDKYGQILLDLLLNAKISLCCTSIPGTICCKNTHGAECDLVDFVNKVKMFIQKGIISEELGCELIKAAQLIIEAVRCSDSCLKKKCFKG